MITAKIIAKSRYGDNVITTFELEYPRFIHSEFMTHRMFSRNSASSRAIPVKKQIENIKTYKVEPVEWGVNKSGMQATETLENVDEVIKIWDSARETSIMYAEHLSECKVHKQIVNRVIEPFSTMKVVLTSTEYENWYLLRDHSDAQPEIHKLAAIMKQVDSVQEPVELLEGEWHVPYYKDGVWKSSFEDSLEDALMVSSSCCAQVSYRKLDDSLEKAKTIYKRLIESKPIHASPFEHQATPIPKQQDWKKINGVTHIDKYDNRWSANFKEFLQYRQILENQ